MLAGEQSCESRQHGPIRRLERWPMNLAAENCHLVTQHDHPDGEIRVSATHESDELEGAAERPIEEGQGHRRMLSALESKCQSAGRRPWMTFPAPTRVSRLPRVRTVAPHWLSLDAAP